MLNRRIQYSKQWADKLKPGQLLEINNYLKSFPEEYRLPEEAKKDYYLLYINHEYIKQVKDIQGGMQLDIHKEVEDPSDASAIRVHFLLGEKPVRVTLVDNKDRPTSLGLENDTFFIDQELYINTLGPVDEVFHVLTNTPDNSISYSPLL